MYLCRDVCPVKREHNLQLTLLRFSPFVEASSLRSGTTARKNLALGPGIPPDWNLHPPVVLLAVQWCCQTQPYHPSLPCLASPTSNSLPKIVELPPFRFTFGHIIAIPCERKSPTCDADRYQDGQGETHNDRSKTRLFIFGASRMDTLRWLGVGRADVRGVLPCAWGASCLA